MEKKLIQLGRGQYTIRLHSYIFYTSINYRRIGGIATTAEKEAAAY